MSTGKIIICILCAAISAGAWIISFFEFREKGILINNAYLYASKADRRKMKINKNMKPYYRQTGTVFIFIGVIFFLNVIQLTAQLDWMLYVVLAVAVITVIYAVVSTIIIEKNKNASR